MTFKEWDAKQRNDPLIDYSPNECQDWCRQAWNAATEEAANAAINHSCKGYLCPCQSKIVAAILSQKEADRG